MTLTIGAYFQASVERLKPMLGGQASGDIRRIFEHHLGKNFDQAIILNLTDQHRLNDDITARENGQPVAQIIGKRAFWNHDFSVSPDVLDPRPDTETLIETAIDGPEPLTILDLGTGSGCILLSLLAHWSNARGVGVDHSTAALMIAQHNAKLLGVAARVKLRRSDWCSKVHGTYDLIVTNPPYIAAKVWDDLTPEVRDWEPKTALCPGPTGLEAYEKIFSTIGPHMHDQSRLLCEIGYDQDESVAQLARVYGLGVVQCYADINAKPRVLELTC